MSIRFKFRSSLNFDALDIGERASIPVMELRSKVLKGKTYQQQQQGLDLVFFDGDSGLEYMGDGCQIPSGSSVIVRRVPSTTMPSAVSKIPAVKNVEMKESYKSNPGNGPADDKFDVFEADLCPEADSKFPDFNLEVGDDDFLGNGTDQVASLSRKEYQKQGPGDLSQETPRGCNQFRNERSAVSIIDQQTKSINPPASNIPAVQCANLPVEMKCPLCNSYFKKAVMIPCCQHSFCQNCICQVLIEKRSCPKCFSSKCRAEDLLPNLSLRQAIEHFLETKMVNAGLGNVLQTYAPDGESGIQARELPQSSSATGKRSNQIYSEAFFESQCQRNVPFCAYDDNKDMKPALPSERVNHIDDMGGYPCHNDRQSGPEDFVPSADFQGENQPVIPPPNTHFEADYNTRRRGGQWTESGGGERNFMGPGGHRKGTRNCYTCGSPYHLMRDCPMSHSNKMFQQGNGAYHGGMPGYAQPPYWSGSSMPPFRQYPHMYGSPGMMPFNTSMVPVSPFAASSFFPSMGGSMPGPGANIRMASMGPPRHSEHYEMQPCENKRKRLNEELERETISKEDDESSECYRHVTPEAERPHAQRSHKDDTHSNDSFSQRPTQKNQDSFSQEKVSRPSNSVKRIHEEISNSIKEEASRNSDSRHRHHHHGESRRHHEKKGHYESESGHKDAKRRPDSYVRGSHLQSPPSDRRREYRDRETSRGYSRHSGRHSGNGVDGDSRDVHQHHKRRVH